MKWQILESEQPLLEMRIKFSISIEILLMLRDLAKQHNHQIQNQHRPDYRQAQQNVETVVLYVYVLEVSHALAHVFGAPFFAHPVACAVVCDCLVGVLRVYGVFGVLAAVQAAGVAVGQLVLARLAELADVVFEV